MEATDNFWDTGVHPITGYIIPGAFTRNTRQNMERQRQPKKEKTSKWGRK